MNIHLNPSVVTLCAVGDISLCDGVEKKITQYGIEFPFLHIQDVFKGCDISFANLENVFTDSVCGLKSQAHLLRSHPQNIRSLVNAGINVVSLANNHILDFGETGLQETISILDTYKIRHTGAGINLLLARSSTILEKKGIRFGFLAYAMKGVHSATLDTAGAAWINDEHIEEDIRNLKSKVDHIIVSLHAGLEFIDYPHPDHRRICLKIAEMGVSLIIGHHPHVIHGIEKVNSCLIAYSLGNLIFDPTLMDFKTESSMQGMVLRCQFIKDKIIEYAIIPTIINKDFQVQEAKGDTQEEIIQRLEKISRVLISSEYPSAYFKQAKEIWPNINIAVNLKIIREQGLLAFLKRLPRIKKIYVVLLLQYIYKKLISYFRNK